MECFPTISNGLSLLREKCQLSSPQHCAQKTVLRPTPTLSPLCWVCSHAASCWTVAHTWAVTPYPPLDKPVVSSFILQLSGPHVPPSPAHFGVCGDLAPQERLSGPLSSSCVTGRSWQLHKATKTSPSSVAAGSWHLEPCCFVLCTEQHEAGVITRVSHMCPRGW